MSLFAIHVEEACRTAVELWVLNTELRATFLDEAAHLSSLADARKVAFHVGHEARHTRLAEGLSEHLQGDSLTRTRGTGYQAVTVGHLANHIDVSVVAMRDVELMVVCVHVSLI